MLKQSVRSVMQPKAGEEDRIELMLVDSREIMRVCLAAALAEADKAFSITASAALPPVRRGRMPSSRLRIALINGGEGRSAALVADVTALRGPHGFDHVIALCAKGDAASMIGALGAGAAAVVPGDVSLDLLLHIVRLVMAGGTYAPASALQALDPGPAAKVVRPAAVAGLPPLTPRQAAVVEALRRGKPNKLIAYELNMCESTVKVHLRTVMKKMRAQSRTHLATIMGRHEALALSA